ncbi:Peroxisomal membrane signal receptor PTS1 [Umbelopsis nana]
MVNGADCSSGANPMSQLMKQFTQDKSLQRDRFESPQAGSSAQSMRTARQQVGPPDQRMLDEFFSQQESSAGPRGAHAGPAFQFSDLHKELDNMQMGPMPHQQGGWASEFNTMGSGPKLWELNPEEAAAMEESFKAGMLNRENGPSAWREEFMNNPALSHLDMDQYSAQFEQAFQKHFDWANEFTLNQDKGKGVNVHDNATWEQEFAAYDSKPELTDEERIAKEIDEAAAAEDTKYFENFESIWQNIKDGSTVGPEGFDNDWEDEFANFNNGADVLKPDLGEYIFEIENPFMSHPDPISEGLRLLEQGGSLSEAALAFEAAVQKAPLDSQAWMHLGNTQAQNEKEEPAIRALEKAVEVDEGNLSALMSLAVSYTNESYDHAAYQSLERWILQKYPALVPPEPSENPFDLHGRVTEMFLAAARAAPEDTMDADVQVGLGVLFYGSSEYEKAVDCFVSALKGRPGDYLLWNRLGATLANSGRSEDAIDAYHKALELRPSFVRARYNLGVSCINIGCYQEAAEHLLGALSMHKRSVEDAEEGVNVSSNLWETLRKTFLMMDRRDLADRAVVGADINQFRDQFEF